MRLSLKEDVSSLFYFKSNFRKILKKVKNNRRPIIITQNGKSVGVFMDIETWENQIIKLNLLKLVNDGEISLQNGKHYSLSEAKEYFKKKLK